MLVYFVVPEYPPHALTGITVPLGDSRRPRVGSHVHALVCPLPAAAMAALAALALAIVPGAIYQINATMSTCETPARRARPAATRGAHRHQHDAMRFLAT